MARNPSSSSDHLTVEGTTAEFDPPLHALGFDYTHLSPEKIAGKLTVTESWCQPFKRMHGGVAAFVAEAVASVGAYIASGFRQVAGIQLSINFIRPAFIGDVVDVEAARILLGKTIQVWEVQQWKAGPTLGEKVLLSTSRVTLICNLPAVGEMKKFETAVKGFAKL